ncbi:MAG: O-antigen ligase family protein [Pseudomonadota bacterium]
MKIWREKNTVQMRDWISSGLVAFAVFSLLLSIVWPRYGFYTFGPIDATPYTILAIIAWVVIPAALLLVPAAASDLWRAVSVRPILFGALLSWTLWRGLSSAGGANPGFSLTYLAREVVYLLPLLPLMMLLARGPNGRQSALSCILLGTLIVTAVALIELMTGQSFVRMTGVSFAGDAQILANLAEANRRHGYSVTRIQSVFGHPIVFGQFLAWAAPFLMFAASGRTKMWMRLTALGCLATLPVLVFATNARSGLIALGASVAAYLAIGMVRRVGLFSLKSAAVAFLAVALVLGSFSVGQGTLGGLIQGRNAVEASSTQARSAMFERGLREISASPILGFGDGQSPQFAGLRGRNGILTIDSAFLSSLLDSGWVGLFLNLSVWGLALLSATRAALHPQASGFDAAVAASLVGVMSVFAVLSIMDNLSLIYISIGLTSVSLLRAQYWQPESLQRAAVRRSPGGTQ